MNNKNILYKTSSPSGDLISFLSGIRKMWMDTGRKAVIYHRLDMIGNSYEGSVHPYENENKVPVCFNQYTFDMMRPLMMSQEYIEDYKVFTGQEHEIDLDKVRLETFTNQPKGSLNRWFNYAFPQMTCDLSKKWILINEGISNTYKDKVIINFTERHRNTFINYFFLKKYQDRIIFSGLKKERDLFCTQWDLDVPHLQVDNFYELAKAISGCKFFLGCQSFNFQIAEATKVKRILEIFPMMPNVVPCGEDAYDFYHQGAVEYYVEKLINQ